MENGFFTPSDDVLGRILGEIAEIERENSVKVLFAVESGSRAWGFASPDSDYDVRFVYKRPLHDYLRLDKRNETLQWRPDDTYDMLGWDVSKYLALLRTSNPSAIEWLDCPRYLVSDTLRFNGIERLAADCMDAKTLAFHHLGMARSNANEFLRIRDGEVRDGTPMTKKYVYVIRAILSACFLSEYGEIPPIELDSLLDEYRTCLEADGVMGPIAELVRRKRDGLGIDVHERIPELDGWVIRNLGMLPGVVAAMEDGARAPWEDVNEMFIRIVTT